MKDLRATRKRPSTRLNRRTAPGFASSSPDRTWHAGRLSPRVESPFTTLLANLHREPGAIRRGPLPQPNDGPVLYQLHFDSNVRSAPCSPICTVIFGAIRRDSNANELAACCVFIGDQ